MDYSQNTSGLPVDEYHEPKKLMIYTGTTLKSVSASQLAHQISEDLSTVRTQISLDTVRGQESRVLVLYTGGTIGMKSVDGECNCEIRLFFTRKEFLLT